MEASNDIIDVVYFDMFYVEFIIGVGKYGYVRVYSISDVIVRFYRLNGKDVSNYDNFIFYCKYGY